MPLSLNDNILLAGTFPPHFLQMTMYGCDIVVIKFILGSHSNFLFSYATLILMILIIILGCFIHLLFSITQPQLLHEYCLKSLSYSSKSCGWVIEKRR